MGEASIPLYQMIYNDLVNKIKTGEYKAGDRIPSEKELAEEFNVSRITSKKALEMMAEEELITRMPGRDSFVLGDYGSENNIPGRKDSSKSTALIGFILPDFSEAFGMNLLSGIEQEAHRQNCFVVMKRSYGRQDIEEDVIDALMALGVNGIIIMPVHGEHYNQKILRLVLDGFPIVCVDRCLNGIPLPFVGTDNIRASIMATDYVLKLGHTDIAILSPPLDNTSTIEERIEGFIKSHAEHGVGIDRTIWLTNLISTLPGKNTEENVLAEIEKIKDLLTNNPQISCLFAVEYNIALLALKAAKALGKRIPEDLSIICFDSPNNNADEYVFTFVRQKENEMGETALKLLLDQMKNNGTTDKHYLSSFSLFKSSSKCCVGLRISPVSLSKLRFLIYFAAP